MCPISLGRDKSNSAKAPCFQCMTKFLETINLANRVLKYKSSGEVLSCLNSLIRRIGTGQKTLSEKEMPLVFACLQSIIAGTLGYKAYDTQLLAGHYLQKSKVVELRTGEGKTLASIFPLLVNVLIGRSCHIVTVNDYLARRDQEWARPVGNILHISTGLIQSDSSLSDRTKAYAKNITYMNTSEVGFDQMRDTLCLSSLDQMQSDLDYVLIDEIDSVLIDSARTPLLLSGQSPKETQLAFVADELARCLKLGEDFEVNSKQKDVFFTASGLSVLEQLLGIRDLYEADNNSWISRVLNSLRARLFFNRNVDYMVADKDIVLLDQITGRALPGRRWSEGLHQAVEAKEGLPVREEPEIIASTTYQNVFSSYKNVCGMSGTVAQAVDEFDRLYGLSVVLLPTNKPSMTAEVPVLVYQSELSKCRGIVAECRITRMQDESPVLVATLDIERSELISELFLYNNICHQLLNARPERAFSEAEIVSQAGRKNTVTVSTNMAGRGTDILLGGSSQACIKTLERSVSIDSCQMDISKTQIYPHSPTRCLTSGTKSRQSLNRSAFWRKVWRLSKQPFFTYACQPSLNIPLLALSCAEREFVRGAGGLYVLSSEKSDSARVDQQLVGRTGRQGDPGRFRFILSLEDKILRQVGLSALAQRSVLSPEAEPSTSAVLARLFVQAQTRVESLFSNVRQQTFKDQTILNYYKSQMLSDRQFVVWDELTARWTLLVYVKRMAGVSLSPEHSWLLHDSRHTMTSLWYSQDMCDYLERTMLLNLLDTSWRQFQEIFLSLKKGLVWKTWGRRDLLTGYIEASQQYLAYQANQYRKSVSLCLD